MKIEHVLSIDVGASYDRDLSQAGPQWIKVINRVEVRRCKCMGSAARGKLRPGSRHHFCGELFLRKMHLWFLIKVMQSEHTFHARPQCRRDGRIGRVGPVLFPSHDKLPDGSSQRILHMGRCSGELNYRPPFAHANIVKALRLQPRCDFLRVAVRQPKLLSKLFGRQPLAVSW